MLILLSAFAQAQVPPAEGNVQLLRSSPDSLRTLWTDDAARGPEGYFQARMIGSFTSRPLVWDTGVGDPQTVVGSAWQTNIIGSGTLGRFRLAVDLPFQVATTSDVIQGGGTGLGDVAIDLKSTLLDPQRSTFGFALSGRVGLPTATVSVPLGGNGVDWELTAIADKSFGPVLLAANLGTRGGKPTTLGATSVGNQLIWRAGAGLELNESLGLSLDLGGRVAYKGDDGAPAEGMLGGWAWLTNSLVLRAGGGRGFGPAIGSPGARALLSVSYEPERDPDADEDGLSDRVDLCPSRPEDLDGFEDADGCPDLDDDNDGIFDVVDACPNVPEDFDGHRDTDGCPDPWTRLGIRLLDESGSTASTATAVLTCTSITKTIGPDQALEVAPGMCTVEASGDGYEPARLEFEVVEGPPIEKELTLKTEVVFATVAVRIRDQGGKLLKQAMWSFDRGPWSRVHDGVAKATLLQGEHRITASAKGYTSQTKSLTVKSGDEVMLEFDLVAQRVVVTRQRIEFDEKVHFETGSATLKSDSFGLLDDIAAILEERPDILAVRVVGHTDQRGAMDVNQKLSEDRAASVVAYLVGKGIAPERLASEGRGEMRPIDPRRNILAYATNRRVELHIESWRDETP